MKGLNGWIRNGWIENYRKSAKIFLAGTALVLMSPDTNSTSSIAEYKVHEDKVQESNPYPSLAVQEPENELTRRYSGRRNDFFSLEDITDENLRKEVIRRYNETNQDDFERIIRRIRKYNSMIDLSSEAYNIDDKLVIGIIYHESGGNPKAKSRKGAVGLMQLTYCAVMDVTGRKLTIREIMNPENNIEFGTSYLSRLINRYNGNVGFGLAAYNAGPTKLSNLLRNNGLNPENSNWQDIGCLLPRETRDYVPKVFSTLLKMEENYAAEERKERTDYLN